MELVLGLVALVGAFAGAIAAHFIAHDAYACCPRYARRLIERAVRALPIHQRARYREEWLADLSSRQGVLSKFKHAIECWLCSGKMAAACRERCAEPVQFAMPYCTAVHLSPGSLFIVLHAWRQHALGQLRDAKELIAEAELRFPEHLRARVGEVGNVAAAIERVISSQPEVPTSAELNPARRRLLMLNLKFSVNGEAATIDELLTDFDWW